VPSWTHVHVLSVVLKAQTSLAEDGRDKHMRTISRRQGMVCWKTMRAGRWEDRMLAWLSASAVFVIVESAGRPSQHLPYPAGPAQRTFSLILEDEDCTRRNLSLPSLSPFLRNCCLVCCVFFLRDKTTEEGERTVRDSLEAQTRGPSTSPFFLTDFGRRTPSLSLSFLARRLSCCLQSPVCVLFRNGERSEAPLSSNS
jgi:hypothetical protein